MADGLASRSAAFLEPSDEAVAGPAFGDQAAWEDRAFRAPASCLATVVAAVAVAVAASSFSARYSSVEEVLRAAVERHSTAEVELIWFWTGLQTKNQNLGLFYTGQERRVIVKIIIFLF